MPSLVLNAGVTGVNKVHGALQSLHAAAEGDLKNFSEVCPVKRVGTCQRLGGTEPVRDGQG